MPVMTMRHILARAGVAAVRIAANLGLPTKTCGRCLVTVAASLIKTDFCRGAGLVVAATGAVVAAGYAAAGEIGCEAIESQRDRVVV